MVFNGEANDQDICTLADNKAGTNDVSFPLKKKAMYATMKSKEVFREIWKVYGGWILDDSANSGEPEALANLTSGTDFYAFATAQALIGVEYQDSAGRWNKLDPITIEEITERGYAEGDFMTTNARPLYYRPVQNGVKLYPAPNFSVSNGLKAFIKRDVVAFVPGDTTKTPGWDSVLHEGLAIGMALEHAKDNTLAVAASLQNDWALFLGDVASHYQRKFRELFPPAIKRRADIVGGYT